MEFLWKFYSKSICHMLYCIYLKNQVCYYFDYAFDNMPDFRWVLTVHSGFDEIAMK